MLGREERGVGDGYGEPFGGGGDPAACPRLARTASLNSHDSDPEDWFELGSVWESGSLGTMTQEQLLEFGEHRKRLQRDPFRSLQGSLMI